MGSGNIITDVFTKRKIPRARQAAILCVPGLIAGVVDSVPEEKKHFVAKHFLMAIATLKPRYRAKVNVTEGVKEALGHAAKKHAKPTERVSQGHRLSGKPFCRQSHGLQENFGKASPVPILGSEGGSMDRQAPPMSERYDPLPIPPKRESRWFERPVRGKNDDSARPQKPPSQKISLPPVAMKRARSDAAQTTTKLASRKDSCRSGVQAVACDHRKTALKPRQLCEDVLGLGKEERTAALTIGTVLSDVWREICALSPHKQAAALSVDGLLLEIVASGSDRRQQRVVNMLKSFSADELKAVLKAEGAREALDMVPDRERKALLARVRGLVPCGIPSATLSPARTRDLAAIP